MEHREPTSASTTSDGDLRAHEERIDAFLAQIEGSDGFPSLSQQIAEVMVVLGSEQRSAQHLADTILKDYSLTLAVIRAANAYHYNRSGRPVISLTHAMVLLGVNTVRNLVSGIVLLDHYSRRAPGLKQLMLLSMLTANHARFAAHRSRLASDEEAYLCGMFRNLGELLVAAHRPDDYARILRGAADTGNRTRPSPWDVLGFDFEDIGEAIARRWNMPPQVLRAMRTPETPRDGLDRVVAFSHALTGAVYRRDPQKGSIGTAAVVQELAPLAGLEPKEVRYVLEGALNQTRTTFRLMRVALDDLRLRRQVEDALAETRLEERDMPSVPMVALTAGALDTAGPAPSGAADGGVRARGADDLTARLSAALDALLQTGAFDRALVAIVNHDRTYLVGRLGRGEDHESLVDAFSFSLGVTGGPLGLALARRQELALAAEWELRDDEMSLMERLGAGSLIAVPVLVKDVMVGCVYADRLTRLSPPDEPALQMVRRVRDGVAAAMSARRAA